MAMTNVLSFDLHRQDGDGMIIITPCIDGVMLTILVEQYECAHGLTDPAGGYGGLVLVHYRYGPLGQYFLGQSEPPHFADAPTRIYVLGCRCGEVGCWPLTCLVTAGNGKITWRSFEQPHRPARDYSSFGPFVFEAEQYKAALPSLPE